MEGNPFTPTFGSEPIFLAGREQIMQDVLQGLENRPGDPNRSTIFVGPRGSGKTVLLARIAEEATQLGWVAARVTAVPGMLERILEQIRRSGGEYLAPEPKTRLTGLSFAGISVARESVSSALPSWGERLASLVDELGAKGVGLLIAVDEVSISPEMVTLAAEYQHLVTEKRNVSLLMAGLPGAVSHMLRDSKISFLRRAFQHRLEAVSIADAEIVIEQTIEVSGRSIDATALRTAAEFTRGFPFLIQLVGYHVWRQHPAVEKVTTKDVQRGLKLTQADMDRMILDNTIKELSRKDLDFLLAMSEDQEVSSMTDIAAKLGASSALAGKYRLRLIEQGLIGEAGYGRVQFELPLLREYLLTHFAG
jgi:Holliday junction resolvasome RuvABC ATP-dependent DNA helicase subunit